MQKRVGFYCWSGPGTVRMIKLKYFDPKINEQSLLESYDYEYLVEVKEKLGVTDAWISYSWGFSDETEKVDKEFTLSRLHNFKKLGIKTHGYIQGPNLVYKDFFHKDWWAKDNKGKLISYHRGRKVVCLNNPEFKQYILNKVSTMVGEAFDGVFMDNIQMGQLGVPNTLRSKRAFFGCKCEVCEQLFFSNYGFSITKAFQTYKGRQLYLDFRVKSTEQFIKEIAALVKASGKEFGTNSFDPKFEMEHVYGTRLQSLLNNQDYVLFENHSLPHKKRDNAYIHKLIEKNNIDKPVFVVSYDKGIGFDKEYSQDTLNTVFSEAENSHFHICLKGSEYVTKKEWHNFLIKKYQKPQRISWQRSEKNSVALSKISKIKITVKIHFLSHVIPYTFLSWIFNNYMEKKSLRKSLSWVQILLLK